MKWPILWLVGRKTLTLSTTPTWVCLFYFGFHPPLLEDKPLGWVMDTLLISQPTVEARKEKKSSDSNELQSAVGLILLSSDTIRLREGHGCLYNNELSKKFGKRPHRRKQIFHGDSVNWHRPVESIAMGCSSHAVMPLLRIQWSVLLHALQQRLQMLLTMWDLDPHLIHGSLYPMSQPSNSISTDSGLTNMTNRQTTLLHL